MVECYRIVLPLLSSNKAPLPLIAAGKLECAIIIAVYTALPPTFPSKHALVVVVTHSPMGTFYCIDLYHGLLETLLASY